MQVTGSTGVTEIEQRTLRKVVWRLVPFLMLCYLLPSSTAATWAWPRCR